MGKYAGSLFQWQRMADGHELIDWMSMSNTMLNGGTLPASVYNGTVNYNNISGAKPTWLNARTNKQILNPTSTERSWVHDSVNPDANVNPNHPDLQHWKPTGANMPCPVGYVIDDNIGNMVDNYFTHEDQNIGNNGENNFFNPFVITNYSQPGNYSIGLNGWNLNCQYGSPSQGSVYAQYEFFNWGTTASYMDGNGRYSTGNINYTWAAGMGCAGVAESFNGNDSVNYGHGTPFRLQRLNLAAVRCVQGH